MFSFVPSHLPSSCPTWERHTLSVWLQRAATNWVQCGTGVPHLTRFLLPSLFKVIPGQATALFTGQGSVLCLVLWKFEMCHYFINFHVSDPNKSFVLLLFHKVFFSMVMLLWFLQQWEDNMGNISNLLFIFSCWMYQIVYSLCVCLQVLCGATFPFPVWHWGEVLWAGVCMGTTSLWDQLCSYTVIAK